MAISTVVLTDTYQQIATGGCFVSVSGSVMVGFGATSPVLGHPLPYSRGFVNSPINYNGSFGAMWIKLLDASVPVNAIVTVA